MTIIAALAVGIGIAIGGALIGIMMRPRTDPMLNPFGDVPNKPRGMH